MRRRTRRRKRRARRRKIGEICTSILRKNTKLLNRKLNRLNRQSRRVESSQTLFWKPFEQFCSKLTWLLPKSERMPMTFRGRS